MKPKTGSWIKTAAGFLFLGMAVAAGREKSVRFGLGGRIPDFSLEHQNARLLLPVETTVSESVLIRAKDGREYYLTVNRGMVNRSYAWWLGRSRQVSYSERVIRSVTRHLILEKYQKGLDVRKQL